MLNQLISWRRELHRYPESAFEEEKTSDFIAARLEEMEIEVVRGFGKTGLVGNLKAGEGDRVIGIRSDIDCIELTEQNDFDYKSVRENRMHACGHDGHIVTVLAAAKLLSESRDFNGTVRFIFQPAEEPGAGAQAMIDDGLFEKYPVDEIYGLHNMPGLPQGTIHIKEGGIMACEDNFIIHIKGKGGHASAPDLTIDPLVVAAQIILALQTVVSRNANPVDTAVVSCTEFHTDGIRNAIPSNVIIKGDTRSFTPQMQALIEDRMRTLCLNICEAYGAECEFTYTHEFAPTVNHPEQTGYALEAAKRAVGKEHVVENCEPMMSSEDFGRFLQDIPGCFVFLGGAKTDNPDDIYPLHNAHYDYNDDNLEIGARYFAELVRLRLK